MISCAKSYWSLAAWLLEPWLGFDEGAGGSWTITAFVPPEHFCTDAGLRRVVPGFFAYAAARKIWSGQLGWTAPWAEIRWRQASYGWGMGSTPSNQKSNSLELSYDSTNIYQDMYSSRCRKRCQRTRFGSNGCRQFKSWSQEGVWPKLAQQIDISR